jgi:hypothetical protein
MINQSPATLGPDERSSDRKEAYVDTTCDPSGAESLTTYSFTLSPEDQLIDPIIEAEARRK